MLWIQQAQPHQVFHCPKAKFVGGANKGRVEKAEGGFAILDKATGLRVTPCPLKQANMNSPVLLPSSSRKLLSASSANRKSPARGPWDLSPHCLPTAMVPI
jgi:hypothetical protein